MAVVYLPVFYGLGITSSYEVTHYSLLFPYPSLIVFSFDCTFLVSQSAIQWRRSTYGLRDISDKNGKSLFLHNKHSVSSI